MGSRYSVAGISPDGSAPPTRIKGRRDDHLEEMHTVMNMWDRVRAHTARQINEEIEAEAKRRVARSTSDSKAGLTRRIEALDEEWDVERYLEMNASALAFTGTILGIFVNKNSWRYRALCCRFSFNIPSKDGVHRSRYSGAGGYARVKRSMPRNML